MSWVWRIPERFNIGVACTDAHLGTPVAGRAAVVIDDDRAGVRSLTFAELAAATTRFAALLDAVGVRPGERVLIRLPNCIEYPIVFLGALKHGAIPVPTSTLLTAEEVLYLARDSGAVAIVTDRATWATM
ncbi:MAG TPA: AMP-binding protein, partial [Candidatus Binatia bacterium]|nr:AMP-binding protein [Candidatus Binatia bacterium]